MLLHLDTNFLIGFDRPVSAERERVLGWVRAGHRLAVSSIAWSEFLGGPTREPEAATLQRLVGEAVAFAAADAELAARLFNAGGRRKGSLPDCQIAAVALRDGATLATANVADFRRFAAFGLRLAD